MCVARPFGHTLLYVVQMGQFYYAAKAFDVLEKLDPNPEYWEGKRGACIGQFQLVVAGRESRLAESPCSAHC